MTSPLSEAFLRLYEIMAALRTPHTGCAWDLEQTFASIAPYTLEEAYEVVEAIQEDNMPALCDELGDLLLQVVFHARIAEESNLFSLKEVIDGLNAKMLRRHPHVFGDPEQKDIIDAQTQTIRWEAIKTLERQSKQEQQKTPSSQSALDGVTRTLPALQRAQKLQTRAANVGFDWPDINGVLDKIEEEMAEVKEALAAQSLAEVQDEIGDLLFCAVNLARKAGIDADAALRQANAKFETRFKAMEALALTLAPTLAPTQNNTQQAAQLQANPLAGYSLEGLEELWQSVKKKS
jgi:nucleoside triphosphate diphosphatase